MKLNLLLSIFALLAFAGTPLARASLIVQGSSFLLTLDDTATNTEQSQLITINGQPTNFTFGMVPVSVTETDTPVAGNGDKFSIFINASQDIFPSTTQGQGNAFMGIGQPNSPLQFTQPVTLTSAFMTATIPPPNSIPIYYEFIGYISQASPWDGEFPDGQYTLAGFTNATGYDIQTLELDLTVVPVPEPLSIGTLSAAALMALARRPRRLIF